MSNRFIVDLGDLKLDDGAKRRIANAIQSAALGELSKLDAVTAAPFAVYDPVTIKNPRWYGIWIKTLLPQNIHPEFEVDIKNIEQFAGGR